MIFDVIVNEPDMLDRALEAGRTDQLQLLATSVIDVQSEAVPLPTEGR
jgi:hypothetical protein